MRASVRGLAALPTRLQPLAAVFRHVEPAICHCDAHRAPEAARLRPVAADYAQQAAFGVEDPEAVGAGVGDEELAVAEGQPFWRHE
jgi:hypothetical protein